MNIHSHPETDAREPVTLPPVDLNSSGDATASRRGVMTRIPGDVVNRATQNLTDHERSAIRRLHRHYVENDLNIREIAGLIRVSETTVSQIFNGKYNAKLDGVVKEIESFFRLVDSRAQGRKLPFTETDLTRQIFNVCDKAREFQKVAFIFSDAQIGKSSALEEYQRRNNHGSTLYTYIPAGGSFASFLLTFCKPLGIAVNTGHAIMRHRIKESFDDRMLLIVDEAHQALPEVNGSRRVGGLLCIEFIRELFNDKKCGIVLCATNAFRDEMRNGDLKKLLAQTRRRRLCALQLPNTPEQDDLDKFAAAYGLAPSAGADRALEKRIIADEALGMWLTLLRMAAKISAEYNQTMTWKHVHLADAAQKSLEGKTF
jgi:hypothetical protein